VATIKGIKSYHSPLYKANAVIHKQTKWKHK